ncbi:transposase, partial [Roseibium sp. RKSG952]|uniref:transposase n=1 Tax=Roseibium sp. RKSG952 TaxID=2529384 RepID=UPI0013CB8141
RAEEHLAAHRSNCETVYAAKSWGSRERRTIARIGSTPLGLDICTIVTLLEGQTPARLYEIFYCARGQAEN